MSYILGNSNTTVTRRGVRYSSGGRRRWKGHSVVNGGGGGKVDDRVLTHQNKQ